MAFLDSKLVMSDYIRLSKLKRQRKKFEAEHRDTIDETEYFGLFDIDKMGKRQRENTAEAFWKYSNEIRAIETKSLRRSAEKAGVQLKPGWLELSYNEKGKPVSSFTDDAMILIRSAIRARRKERRETIEGWVTKVIVPVLGALTGLIGVLLAFYALKR